MGPNKLTRKPEEHRGPEAAPEPAERGGHRSQDDVRRACEERPTLRTGNQRPARRNSRAAVAAEVEAKRASELTFRPRVNRHRSAKDRGSSLEDRIEALSRPKSAYWEKNAQKRAEYEKEAIQECSFAPKVGRGPKTRKSLSSSNVIERLTGENQQKAQKRIEAKLELERAELKECSFKPKTSDAMLRKEEYRPIHERIGDIQRAKHEKLNRAKIEQEADTGLLFRPKINQRSARMAQRRPASAEPASSPGGRPPGAAPAGPCESEFTFAPRINPRSERIVQEAAKQGGGAGSFLERQRQYQRQRMERKQQMEETPGDGDCTFQPQICRGSSLVLSRQHAAHVGESDGEKWVRLSFLDQQRKEAEAMLDEEHYKECTFKPSINERSRRMARARPLTEIASNEHVRRAKERAEQKAAAEFQQQCTFKPKLIRRSSSACVPTENALNVAGADPSELVQRITEYQRMKELQREEIRLARESEELLQCTFTPQVNSWVPERQGKDVPVVVRGLQRHMELQEQARRQKDEQAKIEAEKFHQVPQGASAPFTIPKPFNLATSNPDRSARAARIREENEALELAECTFEPQTKYREQRELIASILGDPFSTLEETEYLLQ